MTSTARPTAPDGLAFRRLVPGLLRAGWDVLRRGGWRLLVVYALSQVIPLALVSPLIHWMFTQALASAGAHAVTSEAITGMLASGISVTWLAGLCVVALLAVSLQLSVLVVAVDQVRRGAGLRPRILRAKLLSLMRRLTRPGFLPLGMYLFLVVPLTQAGVFSVLTHSIAIPNFVSGELLKSTQGTLVYASFLLVAGTAALRYSLAVPLFAVYGVPGGKAMRLSRRATARTFPALLAAGGTAAAAALLAGAALVVLTILPTLAADLVYPRAAAGVAALALGAAQITGVAIAGSLVLFVAGMLLELVDRNMPRLGLDGQSGERIAEPVAALAPPVTRSRRKVTAALVAGAAVVPALILGLINIPVMEGLRDVPRTLVLGHRGFSGGGVENTISGLRAAAAAGTDLVEMDVMQTADGGFVAMHDASLARLAARSEAVADLTLSELTSITVRDQFGHADSIPSLRDYVLAAREAGQPLLIELKLHGGETGDYVERLVAELESLNALEQNIYHSLSLEKAEELKRLRPGLYVGLTLAVAGVASPQTTADFIVVEEASYTPAVRESAWADGKEVYVWTVNGADAIRSMLRDNVDGIITDHPYMALADRSSMGPGEPMSSKLYDAVMRFVVIF
ncbi:glycerophosphoryl diester phosphodiesterase membrane domain-containing protein [Arthrobacter koreensis]|uniref:Glycerophosphoryl diester phosphodiesterase membrane domain-containing protein n=1 Tax=Arthrobacter koreensis TaxID=199136 RepID=A0ABY6FWI4_9MICC|nr:glycerophosphodiester phosphodiesterase family protein [Arthrobacter koreensis]UYB37498.1 glycerophosphoryl diester phosphodiesterase membrane domain-containing protein [Arthrobacter koreensis]